MKTIDKLDQGRSWDGRGEVRFLAENPRHSPDPSPNLDFTHRQPIHGILLTITLPYTIFKMANGYVQVLLAPALELTAALGGL